MPIENVKRYPHFHFRGLARSEPFAAKPAVVSKSEVPGQNQPAHGAKLQQQLGAVGQVMEAAKVEQISAGFEDGLGLQLEFEAFETVELAFEQLANDRSGIEVLNIHKDHNGNTLSATVFVPDGKLEHFEKYIADYISERKNKSGGSLDHKNLLNTVKAIRAASIRSLWTDDPEVLPENEEEKNWLEIWLPARENRKIAIHNFRRFAELRNLRVSSGVLKFPERSVILAYASIDDLQQSIMLLNSVAEIRRAKETAEFFDALPATEQTGWVESLLNRIEVSLETTDTPYICILDTGGSRGHPLLEPFLAKADVHTVNPAWGYADENGHGTGLLGLALLGDLVDILDSDDSVQVAHRLESVKLLAEDGGNVGTGEHHGWLMSEAVARPEITEPGRHRIFSMAITSKDNRDRGRPSAWSATVDSLASDANAQGEFPRLILVSAGNVHDFAAWINYPASNSTDSIHDPAQAWNALTVGAFTNKDTLEGDSISGYSVIAEAGQLSPFSTTAATWSEDWPLKPDVVFEGGNIAKDRYGAANISSLELLTANNKPSERLLTTSNATSAATALAAKMAAELRAEYPTFWPETIRALMTHSAQWTEQMKAQFLPATGKLKKRDIKFLVQHCGFGSPNLEQAKLSAENSLTLVSEDSLQPFHKASSGDPKYCEMNFHNLPWPLEALESLGDEQVEMRVTLSYFVEPNPSARGINSKYRYPSHGLRFDVKRPLETTDEFRKRVNVAARDGDAGTTPSGSDTNWIIGSKTRHRGSLHQDTWTGTAADLASRGMLAVYPTNGWWRSRKSLQRFNQRCRYALVVSIRTSQTDIDLYASIKQQIAIAIDT